MTQLGAVPSPRARSGGAEDQGGEVVAERAAGVVEHGGRSLAVVDLRLRFGLPPAPADMERRIVVFAEGGDGERMGAVVDRVVDVASVGGDQLDPPPTLFRGLPGEYLRGVLRRDGRLVVVLHAARLLSATERLMLASAASAAAAGACVP